MGEGEMVKGAGEGEVTHSWQLVVTEHTSRSSVGPQGAPPKNSGVTTVRVRLYTPTPHCVEQSPHGDQSDSAQSMGV